MKRFLAFVTGVVLACDLAVLAVHAVDARTSLITPRAAPEGGTSVPPVTVVPAPGQAFVSGQAETVVAEGAQGDPIPAPFTITRRGAAGGLTIDRAIVGGRRVSISWDGGTPLPVSGDGALDFGAARVEVDGRSEVVSLDGTGRRLRPGTYSLGAAVAVGAAGLGAAREGVSFTADEQTALSTQGDVVVRLGVRRVELRGPGRLLLNGTLAVHAENGRAQAATVQFGEGPFQVVVEPSEGGRGLEVSGVLQGPVALS